MTSDSNEDRIMERYNEIMADFDKHPYARLMERNVALEARIRELEAERDEAVTQMIEAKIKQDRAQERIRELEGRNMMLQQMVDGLVGTGKTHVIVPVEPTNAMIEAAWAADEFSTNVTIYRAMIRAAQPDAKPQGE